MKVQATAEGGIEIRYNVLATATDDGTAYKTTDTANMSAAHKLYPTSTLAAATNSAVTGNWYHANASASNAFNAKDGTYEVLSLSAGSTSANIFGSTTENQVADQFYDSEGRQYYLVQQFNIRSVSSTKEAADLKVAGITVTQSGTDSANLDKSLRVAIVCGSNTVIYAPITGASTSYKVATAVDSDGNATMPASANVTALTATTVSGVLATAVPAKGTSTYGGVDVRIYVYFEGEDSNHYSDNLTATLDQISISVDFSATID